MGLAFAAGFIVGTIMTYLFMISRYWTWTLNWIWDDEEHDY